jgi:UDP-glucose 6-dehydrogenase
LENESGLILRTVGKDSRIGKKSLQYGFGYGGINLPRDTKTLTDYLTKYNVDTTLITSVKDSNENHLKFLKEYYISQNPDKTNPFVFDYLWYKKDSDSLVDSQPYKLCIELLEEGYHVNVIDVLSLSQKLNQISESYDGKLAVASVIYNRKNNGNKSYPEVVKQPFQFSCWNKLLWTR